MKQRCVGTQWSSVCDDLPLTTLSRLVAIDVSDLSRYRSGDKRMTAATLEKIAIASRVGGDSELVAAGVPTLARIAALIRAGLPELEIISVLSRSLQQAKRLTRKEDARAYEVRPPKTGSRGWDLLLAGVAEDYHRQSIVHDEPQPAWTLERRPMREWWSPIDYGDRFSWAFCETPIALRERGVVLRRGELSAL